MSTYPPGMAARFEGRRVVVALSGGPDSAALARIALRHADTVRAVHVNHGTASSEALERAARAIAGLLDLPLTIYAVEVADGPGWEERARNARYGALLDGRATGETLMTGHTADDQAETVLMRMIRGAGVSGLAGIPERRGPVERPLLDIARSDLANEVTDLPFGDDPANLDRRFERNRIRQDVLPVLELHRPGVAGRLAHLAMLMAEDDSYIESAAGTAPIKRSNDGVRVPLAWLATRPRPVASRVLRNVLRSVHPPYPGSSADIESMLAVVSGQAGSVELPDGLVAFRSGPSLVVERSGIVAPAPTDLPVPGSVKFGGWTLSARREEDRPPALPVSERVAVFDADEVTGPLLVRAFEPADRIAMTRGHKSLADAFGEAGISARMRIRRPVVEHAGRVLWAPGVRRAAFGWVSGTTRRYLWLHSTEEGSWTSNGS